MEELAAQTGGHFQTHEAGGGEFRDEKSKDAVLARHSEMLRRSQMDGANGHDDFGKDEEGRQNWGKKKKHGNLFFRKDDEGRQNWGKKKKHGNLLLAQL
jgi:hypothetical protein